MTHNNRSVAENLRKTVRKLKDQLEAVRSKLIEIRDDKIWSELSDRELAVELLKILEGQ